jgi:uncharacterized protein (DUF433 family)
VKNLKKTAYLLKFYKMDAQISSRITINSAVCNGKPTIRNMRFTVADLLGLLASGMSHSEILEDYSYLEAGDIEACLLFATRI